MLCKPKEFARDYKTPDRHRVDLARADVGQQLLQGGTVEGGTGEGAVVIAGEDQPSTLVRLALDVSLASLALGVERVEFEVEVMLGRFAGIDGAAKDFSFGCHDRGALLAGRLFPGEVAVPASRLPIF